MRLASRTPEGWAAAVAADPVALLSDHAHCELKAAASAMTMLKRNPGREGLATRLAVLIKEECDHLQRVLRELSARGAALAEDRPSPYADGLRRAAAASRRREDVYLDALLVSALIEKRSHERFARLLECAALAELHPLYRALEAAERRHGELFVELACEAFGAPAVSRRWEVLAAAEADVAATVPFDHRIHAGPP